MTPEGETQQRLARLEEQTRKLDERLTDLIVAVKAWTGRTDKRLDDLMATIRSIDETPKREQG